MEGQTTKPDVRAVLTRISPEMHRELKIAAAEDGVTLEQIVRSLIAGFLRERTAEDEPEYIVK